MFDLFAFVAARNARPIRVKFDSWGAGYVRPPAGKVGRANFGWLAGATPVAFRGAYSTRTDWSEARRRGYVVTEGDDGADYAEVPFGDLVVLS